MKGFREDYILWGITNAELREAYRNGLPTRFRLVFDEKTGWYKYCIISLTKDEVKKVQAIIKDLNKKRDFKLQLFTMEEWVA